MQLKIWFVGDKPSKNNVNIYIPFVGTQSYKKLLEWIWFMDIDISGAKLCNSTDHDLYSSLENFKSYNGFFPKVIVLGNNAENKIKQLPGRIPYFKLPHPSGLNRILNDKKRIKELLKDCKDFINS